MFVVIRNSTREAKNDFYKSFSCLPILKAALCHFAVLHANYDPCGFRDFMNNTRDAGAVGKKKKPPDFTCCLCQGLVMDLPSNAVSTKETFWFAGPHTVHAGVISVLHARRSGCSPFVSKSRVLCRIHVPSHIPTGNLLSRPGGRKSSTFSANKRVPSGSRRAKRTVQL